MLRQAEVVSVKGICSRRDGRQAPPDRAMYRYMSEVVTGFCLLLFQRTPDRQESALSAWAAVRGQKSVMDRSIVIGESPRLPVMAGPRPHSRFFETSR